MWKNNTEAVDCPAESPRDVLPEVQRLGAQRMLGVAVMAEAEAYVEAHRDLLDDDGPRLQDGPHAASQTVARVISVALGARATTIRHRGVGR